MLKCILQRATKLAENRRRVGLGSPEERQKSGCTTSKTGRQLDAETTVASTLPEMATILWSAVCIKSMLSIIARSISSTVGNMNLFCRAVFPSCSLFQGAAGSVAGKLITTDEEAEASSSATSTAQSQILATSAPLKPSVCLAKMAKSTSCHSLLDRRRRSDGDGDGDGVIIVVILTVLED